MANFFSSYGDQEYVMLHSNRRTDAIVLDTLISEQPDSDLIPKVVRGLMAARDNGRWDNTQENVFVILAMDDYFNTFENVAPDFIARVWLGDTYVAENPFQGYTTETYETTVPMSYLTEQEGTQDVIDPKGRRRAPLLPPGDDVCAHRPEASTRWTWALSCSAPTRRWTTRPTCP